MAISSRRQQRSTINIWPGFVDALSQLIMVIVFVLLIFTAGQFYLTDALSGRDAALQKLTQQINELTDTLAMERRTSADLQVHLSQLTLQLQAANQAATEDKAKMDAQLKQIGSLQQDIDALKQVRDQLEAKVQALAGQLQQSTQDLTAARDRSKELEARLSTAEERTALAQKEIDARDVQIKAAQSTVNDLNQQLAALRQQLAQIAAALDASETKDKAQQVQIADLGRRLNTALASKVEELARYRSEFFGRLRQILGDRPGIRIVGDRFVFQSEVLFAQGSAELSDDAKKNLVPVADSLKQIAAEIPPDIPWVLRVDGHTDKRPINTPQFPSNWELSTARALSVVRYLVELGVPPDRLAAAGFGEFQPIDPGDTEAAYQRNRRIELKLTER